MRVFKHLFIILVFASYWSVFCDVLYPYRRGTTWKVGQQAKVIVKSGQKGETVSIFFNNYRKMTLTGGPIDKNNGRNPSFQFIVPSEAFNSNGELSELIIVHRVFGHLTSVDIVYINVIS
ncbi:MAG: hypothetical protein EXX96DRAFT_557581 [Benjaminiella poitrasii]|nr:MAG: hypothetical protein EXX96DRAFT_557581 [Benjaminiella poitrasii]